MPNVAAILEEILSEADALGLLLES